MKCSDRNVLQKIAKVGLQVKDSINEKCELDRLQQGWIIECGRMDYSIVWALQQRLIASRKCKSVPDCLLLTEHPPVITLGRAAKKSNILLGDEALRQIGITCYHVERGGDVTYHGTGQMIAYPILDLRGLNINLQDYVWRLEEVMIRTLCDFSLQAYRSEQNRGVWIQDAKIGSIGIAVRHSICFHGFALNICPNLEHFKYINPCGMANLTITSMAHVLGWTPEEATVKKRLIWNFCKLFPGYWSFQIVNTLPV